MEMVAISERIQGLTRIRPKFWTFQEKHPIFGPNPFEFNFGVLKSNVGAGESPRPPDPESGHKSRNFWPGYLASGPDPKSELKKMAVSAIAAHDNRLACRPEAGAASFDFLSTALSTGSIF